jgi:F0F1-type ATP synthase membrane subunit b/b'
VILRLVCIFLLNDVILYASESSNAHLGTLIWRIITFLIFVIIIYKLSKTPILETLDRRKEKIKSAFDAVRERNASLDNDLTLENNKLLQVDNEIENIKSKYRKQMENEKRKLIDEYELELIKLKQSIERSLEMERKKYITTLVDNIITKTRNYIANVLQKDGYKKNLAISLKKNIEWLDKFGK